MSHPIIIREQIKKICTQIEDQNAGYGLANITFLWDCGKPMGEPKSSVEVVPGLFGLVFRTNTSKVIIGYPEAKRWVEPAWEMSLHAENPRKIFPHFEQ